MITRAKLSSVVQGLPKYRSMLAGNTAYQPTSYESIASATPTGTNVVTFSSIPQSYKHLQIRALFTDASTNTLIMRFNGDSGSNYNSASLEGNGTTVGTNAAYTNPNIQVCFRLYGGSTSASYYGAGIIDINNYNDTNKFKTVISYFGVNQMSTGVTGITQGGWYNTAAIDSITLSLGANYLSGTTFSLYGIRG